MRISTGKLATGALILLAVGMGVGHLMLGFRQATVPPKVAAPARLTGDQLCARDLTKFVQFNDPESIRINGIQQHAQQKNFYRMSVWAKNDQGRYSSAVTCSCTVDEAAGKATDMSCG